jgi:hypothetical protein
MARQIDNAMAAHAEHRAEYMRREAFHRPMKQVQRDQRGVGPSFDYPTAPHDLHRFGPGREDGLAHKIDGHKFGPGMDGSDMSKLPCNM